MEPWFRREKKHIFGTMILGAVFHIRGMEFMANWENLENSWRFIDTRPGKHLHNYGKSPEAMLVYQRGNVSLNLTHPSIYRISAIAPENIQLSLGCKVSGDWEGTVWSLFFVSTFPMKCRGSWSYELTVPIGFADLIWFNNVNQSCNVIWFNNGY